MTPPNKFLLIVYLLDIKVTAKASLREYFNPLCMVLIDLYSYQQVCLK